MQCSIHQFHCIHSSECIPLSWQCDGQFDCGDQTDENQCDPVNCTTHNSFKCLSSSTCVPFDWVCDYENDCIDASDEHNCNSKLWLIIIMIDN